MRAGPQEIDLAGLADAVKRATDCWALGQVAGVPVMLRVLDFDVDDAGHAVPITLRPDGTVGPVALPGCVGLVIAVPEGLTFFPIPQPGAPEAHALFERAADLFDAVRAAEVSHPDPAEAA